MRTPITVVLSTSLLFGCPSFAQTPKIAEVEQALAKLAPLRVSIYGKPLRGARELEPMLAGKTEAQADAIWVSERHAVKKGESFQLKVELEGPGGVRTVVTSDPKIRYESMGCFTVSTSGFVTVTPGSQPCYAGKLPELWIALVDAKNKTTAWNRYFFKVN